MVLVKIFNAQYEVHPRYVNDVLENKNGFNVPDERVLNRKTTTLYEIFKRKLLIVPEMG